MVLEFGFIVFGVISSCPDNAKDLAAKAGSIQKATPIPPDKSGLRIHELMPVFDLPQTMDGDVAHLHSQKDLHVFGIVSFEKPEIEFVQIWGFDEFPMPIATIYMDGHRPTNREIFHFPLGQNVAYAAIRHDERLLAFMKSKGFFNFTPEQEAAAIAEAKRTVHETFFEAESKGIAPRTWRQVRRDVLKQEHSRRFQWRGYEELPGEGKLPEKLSKTAREATIPNPPNREESRTTFSGWLPQDGYAAAALQYVLLGKEQGLFVYLNPSLAKPFHRSFASIPERIGIEGRFRIDWLKLTEPVVIEIDGEVDHRQMYLVFDGRNHLPRGIPFYEIDPATGFRLTDRPRTLSRDISPRE